MLLTVWCVPAGGWSGLLGTAGLPAVFGVLQIHHGCHLTRLKFSPFARSGGRVVAVITVLVVHGNRSKLIRNGPGVFRTSNESLWLIPVCLQIKWCSVRHLRDPYGWQQVT
ncbi:uncharacterized protein LOC120356483 [Nilaparvata lugens]|uniref:uncharacterized protein LOC120356483 n=1 Tax=Nilaparvata lugens TaxID=108931 RepID=UPI00193E9382|nr:uncharacterized protein LOC120356483 [Nilaparvata lugens]